jgi:hypothetical protein
MGASTILARLAAGNILWRKSRPFLAWKSRSVTLT